MSFEEQIDGEVGTTEGGDEGLGRVDVPFAEHLAVAPRVDGPGRIDGVGTECGRVGESDDQVSVRTHHSVHLSKHPIEVVDQ